jgi:PAS domain S-box-containing protein
MHPGKTDTIHNSTFERTIRYIGISFAGLAFVLIIVCASSLRITRQVQKEYDLEVGQVTRQLKLVNTLHHNEDMVHNLLMSHINTAEPHIKDELREDIKQGHVLNTAAILELQSLVNEPVTQELLQHVIKERISYYTYADSVLLLSEQNRTKEAIRFARAFLEPDYENHERYLNKLDKQIQETADKRIGSANTSISSSVDNQTYLLILALVSAVGAVYIITRVFKGIRQENGYLNAEIQERLKLEQELSEQRREYKMLFNRNPVPMWVYDQNTFRFLEVNKAAELEYGFTEEEFLQMTLLDIRPQEETGKFLDWMETARKYADTASSNFIHKRKDGTVFRVELKSHALPIKKNIPPRLVVAVNVQEREQAIEQLKKNEKQLQEVSSSLPGAVFQYQMERGGSSCFPFISDGVRELCGVTPEEVYRDPVLLFKNVHADDLARVQNAIAESYRSLTPWEQELRVWQVELEKYMWVRGHSLPSAKGNGIVLWNGTLIDITKQKEAQEKLERNEAKLKALLDSSLQAIFLLDENLMVISFNKEAAADVRRYLLKDLKTGQSMVDFVTHQEVPVLIKNHAIAMRGETVMYESNQGNHWHEIAYRPVVSPEGPILGVALNIRDITEQKKSFETIKRNELQLARAQQLARLGSWEYHIKQDVLTWSEGTYAIYGLKKGKFAPSVHNVLATVYPDDRMKVQAAYKDAIQNRHMLNLEHRIMLPNGAVVDVLEVAEVICDDKGEVVKLYGTVQDITERKKAEQEITDAKNLLQTTVENIPEIIFIANTNLTIVYISPQCEHITGYPEEAFLGDHGTWLQSIHSNDKEPLMLQVLPEVLAGHPQEYEMRLLDSQGRLRWLLLRMTPGRDSAGRVTRIYGSASDMTAYKEAEARQQELSQQLMKQNQNLQQFAYIVSHNLRAPIANMLGLTSIYNRNEIGSPINQKVIDNLMKSAQLLDTTIRDLNDLLTIRSQIGSVYETVYFDCLLQDVMELLKTDIASCGATISHNFNDAPAVSAVRSYAQSILLNLLSNAIKYRCPGRNLIINVTTKKLNGYICLRVQDNGSGIDLEKQQENIFGLYKRFHKGIEGKGIGLHLVKTQVEMLQGKVEVESEPQEGTTFKVYFKS